MQSVDTLGLIYPRKFRQPHLILVLDSSSYCFVFTILPLFFLGPASFLFDSNAPVVGREKEEKGRRRETFVCFFCHVLSVYASFKPL